MTLRTQFLANHFASQIDRHVGARRSKVLDRAVLSPLDLAYGPSQFVGSRLAAVLLDAALGCVGIASGFLKQCADFARRGGQLRFMFGEQLLGVLMLGRGRGNVVGDLALALVERRRKSAAKPTCPARTTESKIRPR